MVNSTPLLTMIAIIIATCVLQRIPRKIIRLWERALSSKAQGAPPFTICKQKLVVDIPGEVENEAVSFEHIMLALSPVQDVFDPLRRYDPAKEQLQPARITTLENAPASSSMEGRKLSSTTTTNLALSKIILTINIPPTPLSNSEDHAIVELSELLRSW
jgi:hypothetical protein